ncbi:MAG: hypothetical protein ABW321_21040 [Polyangiales bacterium]
MTEPSADAKTHVIDVLRAFLAARPEGSGHPAARLVIALRQFFVAHEAAAAISDWHGDDYRPATGARASSLRGRPTALGGEQVAELHTRLAQLLPYASWPQREMQHDNTHWTVLRLDADHRILIGLRCTHHGDADAAAASDTGIAAWAELHIAPEHYAFACAQAEAFQRDVDSVRLFVSALELVHSLERTETEQLRLTRARGRLNELLTAADPRSRRSLSALSRVLAELTETGALTTRSDLQEQAGRIARLALNRVLQEPHSAAGRASIQHYLRVLAQKLGSGHDPAASALATELQGIAQCIDPSPHCFDALARARASDLRTREHLLLAVAVREVANVRPSQDSRTPTERLRVLAQVCREHLPELLIAWIQGGDERGDGLVMHSALAVQNWLRLWFVLDVAELHLSTSRARGNPLESEQLAVFRALAVMLRECLRTQLHGASPGFQPERALITHALRVLVQHHARWRSGVPSAIDLTVHLEEIDANRQGQIDAEGHLEHVLDVYVGGYYIANMRIGKHADVARGLQKAAVHIGGKVAHGASPQATADSLTAFALAALFHDAGMMLFPILPPLQDKVASDDAVGKVLSRIHETVADGGRSLVAKCITELKAHGCLDLEQTAEFQAWLDRQRHDGEPDHALLSAWYLMAACTRAGDSLPKHVMQAAVRATVLHGALGACIESNDDPIAALLVLCDELFDWRPSRRQSQSGARSFDHEASVLRRRRRGRARRFGMAGLWLHIDADGKLIAGLDPEQNAARPGRDRESTESGLSAAAWPTIVICLRHPQDLDAEVMEHWLRSAQNLGRIRRSSGDFGPCVVLEHEVPPRLQKLGKDTRWLLDETFQRTRNHNRSGLKQWLENADIARGEDAHGKAIESVALAPLHRAIATDDIEHHLEELILTAFDVIEDLERAN